MYNVTDALEALSLLYLNILWDHMMGWQGVSANKELKSSQPLLEPGTLSLRLLETLLGF